MSGPTVTTVIPAYKAAKTIGRALESVFAQTRPPNEVLVIDDGSPDDVSAAVAPYGSRVWLIRKSNGGVASARNRGIDEARGELIAFLDADDSWEPTKLERHLQVFERHSEVGLTASWYFTQEPGQPRTNAEPFYPVIYDQVLRWSGEQAFGLATQIWTTTVVVRRAALGSQRFESGLEPAEDRDLWVRLVTQHPAYLLSELLATAILEPGSLSRSNVDVDCSNMLRVVRRNRELLGRKGLRTWEAHEFRRWAGGHLANGQPRAALKPAWNRLRLQPLSPEAWWVLLKSASGACAL
jgi:glycosyltransferase involved in cell wall biosynthesis